MTKEDIIKEFSSIKGIGQAKAKLMYKNGFTSMDKLKKASIEDLTKLQGITEKIAAEMLNQLVSSSEKETEKTDIKKGIAKKKVETGKKSSEEKSKKTEKPIEKTEKQTDKKPDAKEEGKVEKKPAETKRIIEKTKDQEESETLEEEEKVYKARKKPKLTKDLKNRLRLRKQIKNRTPDFLREEWYRYKKIPKNWRKPDGITSKMRINLKYRPSMARVGFRGPRETRYLHSSGFEEVPVHNIQDIEKLNPETQAARIGSTVGTKKRLEIQKRADELDIRILNRS